MSVADALFGRVKQRVLAILYGHPDQSFYANEIIRAVNMGTGAVQRELEQLAAAELITVTRRGNQKHYQANKDGPVFAELRGLVIKSSGVADVLREALAPLADRMQCAFVFGSVARREDTSSSDIDLMVVSDVLTHAELFGALEEASATLARAINPSVYSPDEMAERIRGKNSFMIKVMAQPRLWIIGNEHALPT